MAPNILVIAPVIDDSSLLAFSGALWNLAVEFSLREAWESSVLGHNNRCRGQKKSDNGSHCIDRKCWVLGEIGQD